MFARLRFPIAVLVVSSATLLALLPVASAQPAEPTDDGVQPSAALAPQPDTRWVGQLHERVSGSVVAISSASSFATGFVVHSNRHVLTTYAVVELGRPIDVRFQNGDVIRAVAIAVDAPTNLAVLELERPGPGAPLELADDVPAIGDSIAVVLPIWLAFSLEPGAVAWFIDATTVGGVDGPLFLAPSGFQPSSTNELPASAFGAPVLMSDGRVAGTVVSSQEGIVIASPSQWAHNLVESALTRPEPYNGRWTFHFNAGWTMLFQLERSQKELDAPNGFMFGLGASLNDRWLFELRMSQLFIDTRPEDPGQSFDVDGQLFELLIGHRFLLSSSYSPATIYVVPRVGVSIIEVDRSEDRLELVGGDLDVVTTNEDDEPRFHPTIQLGFGLSRFLELGAGFHFDVEHIDESDVTVFLRLGV